MKLILFYIIVCATSLINVESTAKKKLYNDLLTEDNELLLIQQHHLNNTPKKQTNNTNNSSKQIKRNFSEKLTSLSNNANANEPISSPASSKLIVKIVYASKLEENTPKSNTVSKKLIYLASSYSNSCDKHMCKSNETCIVTNEQEKGYKCLPKISKKLLKTTRVNEKSFKKKSQVDMIFSEGCNMHSLIELKLRLFSHFETQKRINNNLKQSEITKINLNENHCIESIAHMLNLIDINNDQLITFEEWSELDNTRKDKCSSDLFNKCDEDSNGNLSYKEFCKCFEGSDHKCKFMRNPANIETKLIYIKYLNEQFSMIDSHLGKSFKLVENLPSNNRINLNVNSYIPMCDVNGHFMAHQCDNNINCWCVNKSGEPLIHTIKKIHENPFDCNFI